MSQNADPTTTITTDESIAKAGIAQATADGTPGAAAPAESKPAEAAKPAPENPFASEDAELARLEAEAAAGPKAAGEAPGAGTDAVTAEAGDKATPKAGSTADVAAAAAAATASGHRDQTVAVIALRKANSELKGALLVKEGENRVLKTLVDPGKFAAEAGGPGAAAEELSPEEQELQALAADRIKIAEEVDGGRMTMREYAEKTNEIAARERALALTQAEQVAAAQAQPANDLGLQEHVTTLVQKYPILNSLTAAQLKPFEQIAYDEAEREGKPIQSGPVGTKDLRERMGALATKVYGQPATAAAATTGAGPAGTGSTVTAQPTAAEREAKLRLAGNHPPDIGGTGSGATGGEPSEAQASAALAQGEDAAIRWLEANPGFVHKTMGKSMRLTR